MYISCSFVIILYYNCLYSGRVVWLINHGLGDKLTATHTDQLITSVVSSDDGVYMHLCVCLYVYYNIQTKCQNKPKICYNFVRTLCPSKINGVLFRQLSKMV